MSVKLHEVSKQILYLDQNALSEMMKAVNPYSRARAKGVTVDRWVNLFARLHAVVRLQRAICVSSSFHEHESIVSPFYEQLKEVARVLSGGVHFESPDHIERFQVIPQFRNWIKEDPTGPTLDVNRVVAGHVDRWLDLIDVTIASELDAELAPSLRTHRAAVESSLSPLVERWRRETQPFQECYRHEAMSWGRTVLTRLSAHYAALEAVRSGQRPFTLDNLMPPAPVVLVNMMQSVLMGIGVSSNEWSNRIRGYLESEATMQLPFNHIQALLFAGLARRVRSGQREIRASAITDVRIISHLAPYCDAMFVDNAMLGLLQEKPIPELLGIKTRFFAARTLPSFVEYLDALDHDTPMAQRELVDAIYGPDQDLEAWAEDAFRPR